MQFKELSESFSTPQPNSLMEDENAQTESKYAGLSKGQIKKLKAKEKAEKEAAA